MRLESGRAAKALAEQTKSVKGVVTGAAATARNIKQISRANNEHVTVSGALLSQLSDIRTITDRNTAGVKETRSSTSRLLEQATALTAIMDRTTRRTGASRSTNGTR
jgi:methyl-accepting chemotaxis protein